MDFAHALSIKEALALFVVLQFLPTFACSLIHSMIVKLLVILLLLLLLVRTCLLSVWSPLAPQPCLRFDPPGVSAIPKVAFAALSAI